MNLLDIIAVPFGYVIQFFHFLTNNYFIALFLFALVVKLILFPLSIRQQKTQIKQAKLRPLEMAIRKKYAGRDDKPTQMKMNEEIQQLYSEQKFNPLSGCLPLLLQFPIIIGLYQVVINPLRYMCHLSADVITQLGERVKTLAGFEEFTLGGTNGYIRLAQILRDNFAHFGDIIGDKLTPDKIPDFHLAGNLLDLSETPSFSIFKEPFGVAWLLLLVPVLTFVFQFLSSRLMKKLSYQPTEQNRLSNCLMDVAMPLLTVYFCFRLPAAVAVYWWFQNILGVVQQYVLVKMYPIPTFTEEELKEAERQINAKEKQKKKPKSLYQDEDSEDYSDYAKELAARYAREDAEEAAAAEAAASEEDSESSDTALPDGAPKLKSDDRSATKFEKKKK